MYFLKISWILIKHFYEFLIDLTLAFVSLENLTSIPSKLKEKMTAVTHETDTEVRDKVRFQKFWVDQQLIFY